MATGILWRLAFELVIAPVGPLAFFATVADATIDAIFHFVIGRLLAAKASVAKLEFAISRTGIVLGFAAGRYVEYLRVHPLGAGGALGPTRRRGRFLVELYFRADEIVKR